MGFQRIVVQGVWDLVHASQSPFQGARADRHFRDRQSACRVAAHGSSGRHGWTRRRRRP